MRELLTRVDALVVSARVVSRKRRACLRVVDAFQRELDALARACDEQERERRVLRDLLDDQDARADDLAMREDGAFVELNALAIDARAFAEEQRLAGDRVAAVEAEVDAASRVRLLTLPFRVRADAAPVDDAAGRGGGRYPTINGLRLACRPNARAGLGRAEIDAAFASAARLLALALGRRRRGGTGGGGGVLRLVPTLPRAKLLVDLPERREVHELGIAPGSKRVPARSLRLFLVLLHQLSTGRDDAEATEAPPFPITEGTIDGVDLSQLAESDTAAWSSVVFSMAAHLRWLSESEL